MVNEEELGKKATKFIKSNMMNFIVVLISLSYIFYNMVVIKRTDLSVWECICATGVGIIVGILIKEGLGETGFNKGYNSEKWNEEQQKYNLACAEAVPYMERVDNFYLCEEIEKKKTIRITKLTSAKLKYYDFFDEDGNYTNPEIRKYKKKIKKEIGIFYLDRKQRKILKKCIKLKIYQLNLFSEYEIDNEKYTKKEFTDKDQRAKMFGKNSISQILIAIAGVYFVPLLNGWDWAKFIFATIQVACWVGTGVSQLYTNYNYVVFKKVDKLKDKKQSISKFIKGCEREMYKVNPYDLMESRNYEKVAIN